MVTLRKRAQTLETPANPKRINNKKTQISKTTEEISGYEQCRDKRIKENMERMQKLGIIDLSLKLKSELFSPKLTPRNPSERKTHQRSPLPSSGPQRRSSRLQNVTPVSYSATPVRYSELPVKKTEKSMVEHENRLGTCELSWTLSVDGYGTDGNRIYDSINGKTCHQCRQKTLGHRTHCSKCNKIQGQFCGDCLYNRYGENVVEAIQNPSWICPVCRGICNCSLCRRAKGWPPTGPLCRKVSSLGFKSVAHYLIQTQRSKTNSEENQGTDYSITAKRSLHFANMEEPSQQKESLNSEESSEPVSEGSKDDEQLKGQKEESQSLDSKLGVGNVASVSEPRLETNPARASEPPSSDSIAGRLKQWRNRC